MARVVWGYKLAPATVNLAAKNWPEMEVFRIEAKNYDLPRRILEIIDARIPYLILFLITKGAATKAVIGYKKLNAKDAAKVEMYFETAWNDARLAELKIEGLDVDAVYANLLRVVAGEGFATEASGIVRDAAKVCDAEDIEVAVARAKERAKIQQQIAVLERKIKSEPSIGKKQRLAEEKYRLMQLL